MKLTVFNILFFFAAMLSAQPMVRFSALHHNLGEVGWLTPREVAFDFINAGNEPLKILDVRPDCDCTDAVWPQSAIAKGEVAQIKVRFDATLLGSFNKNVAVYTNADEEPVYLQIAGKVVKEVTFRSEDFAYHIGDFQLSTNQIEFDNVEKGATPKVVVQLYNGSTHAYHPELMHLPRYLSVVATPNVINPGKVGELHFELNTSLINDVGLSRSTIYLSRFVGDRISEKSAIDVFVTMVPKMESTPELLENAPKIAVSDTVLAMGKLGKKTKLKGKAEIFNQGNAPLEIQRLQVYNPGLRVSLNNSVIKPGGKAKLNITLSADALGHGKQRVLLITNDPRSPKVVVDLEVDE